MGILKPDYTYGGTAELDAELLYVAQQVISRANSIELNFM